MYYYIQLFFKMIFGRVVLYQIFAVAVTTVLALHSHTTIAKDRDSSGANKQNGRSYYHDFPSNPMYKQGWELVVNDEFNGPQLDETLWIPEYFPGRFTKPYRAFYYFSGGAIHLHVNDPKAQPMGDYQSISSIQTFNIHNLHKNYASSPEDVVTVDKFTQLYGWYEIRAKHPGAMHHIAFWMLEAKPSGSEIDINEDPAWTGPFWHNWGDPEDEFPESRMIYDSYDRITSKEERANSFHLYALEVFEGGAHIYHDNQLVERVEVDWKKRGEIPLMFLLGVYGSTDPKNANAQQEYVIDYFRAYKKER